MKAVNQIGGVLLQDDQVSQLDSTRLIFTLELLTPKTWEQVFVQNLNGLFLLFSTHHS